RVVSQDPERRVANGDSRQGQRRAVKVEIPGRGQPGDIGQPDRGRKEHFVDLKFGSRVIALSAIERDKPPVLLVDMEQGVESEEMTPYDPPDIFVSGRIERQPLQSVGQEDD